MMTRCAGLINGRVPMVMGTGATRTEDSIMYAKAAKDAGADALLVTTPPYAYPTGREIALHALAVDRAANLPVMLYNYEPDVGRHGRRMSGPVGPLSQLLWNQGKFGDINRLHMLARDYPHIALSCGMDDQALEFFAWGARSWVCAGSNFAPEAHIGLYEACVIEGDFKKGARSCPPCCL